MSTHTFVLFRTWPRRDSPSAPDDPALHTVHTPLGTLHCNQFADRILHKNVFFVQNCKLNFVWRTDWSAQDRSITEHMLLQQLTNYFRAVKFSWLRGIPSLQDRHWRCQQSWGPFPVEKHLRIAFWSRTLAEFNTISILTLVRLMMKKYSDQYGSDRYVILNAIPNRCSDFNKVYKSQIKSSRQLRH